MLKTVSDCPIPVYDTETEEGRVAQGRAILDLLGVPTMAGGAEIFPDEGLDHILNKVPRATTAIQTTYYLGLNTGQTTSTVPSRDAALTGSASSPYTSGTSVPVEPTGGAYARVAVANTDWGAIATNGVGRRTTSAQKSFAENTASWGNINGFFLASAAASTAQNTGVAIFYANFDDGTAVPATVAGYTIRITPYFHVDQ